MLWLLANECCVYEDFWRRLANLREQLIVMFQEMLCMLPGF